MWRNRHDILIAAANRTEQRLLREKARIAQRRKDWHSAEILWRQCWEKAPEERNANIGYIGILIYAGDTERARKLAEDFVRRFPNDENGPVLLARLAEARGDFDAAIEQWRAALAIEPSHLQSLIRLGAALLKLERFEEAEACASRLCVRYPAEPHGAILHAQAVQQTHGYSGAAEAWKRLADTFPDDVYALRAHARALLAAARYDECLQAAARLRALDPYESVRLAGQVRLQRARYADHTEFWAAASRELPNNPDVTRQWLNAALWARRLDDAERAFQQLLSHNRVQASDADYAVGLAHAYLENGNREEARTMARAFLYRLRKRRDYRPASLRLIRLILASFPRTSRRALQVSQNELRFRRMVANARLGGNPVSALLWISELEEMVRKSGTRCFLDTDIASEECRAFVELVRGHLRKGISFSFIRLGDAEATALGYEPALARYFDCDTEIRERVWWGRTLDGTRRAELGRRVRLAIESADGLGIPTRGRMLRDIRLDQDQRLSSTHSGRGLLTVMRAIRELVEGRSVPAAIASAHIHQDLQRWRLYPALFEDAGPIVVVSGHPELAKAMKRQFGVAIEKSVTVPPGDAALEMQGRSLLDEELPPQSIERALNDLGDSPRGKLVLVGAGYAGKILVDEAKRRGGIALDVGSIFDTWLGLHTRSYQDIA